MWIPNGGVALIVLLAFAVPANCVAGQTSTSSAPAIPAASNAGSGSSKPESSTQDAPVPDNHWVDTFWPNVRLNVLVTDKHGAPQKVEEQTFQLLEDGVPRQLSFSESADSPVSLALVIDSSGSIYKRKLDVLSFVQSIVHGLPPDSEVMAVLFTNQAYLDLPLTPASHVDFSFLDRLHPAGPTALWDAVFLADRHLVSHARYARRAMVIVSDGEENASGLKGGNALWAMLHSDAPPVYACRVTYKHNVLDSQGRADSYRGGRILRSITERAAGLDFKLDQDTSSVAAEIVTDIRNQHILQFTTADPARNGKEHKLEVKLPDKEMKVHAFAAYFAPKQ